MIEDLLAAGQENVAETYLGLARALGGNIVFSERHFRGAASPRNYSFCNFVLDLQGEEGEQDGVCRELARQSRSRPWLRVFVHSGPSGDAWQESLRNHGFVPVYRLVHMGWGPEPPFETELIQAVGDHQREAVAAFMSTQFFAANEAQFRRTFIQATVASGFPLMGAWEGGILQAAYCESETPQAIGLYNLCVHPARRRQGLGARLLRNCQSKAARLGKPVVLQCDPKLTEWYERHNFKVFGEMQSFQCRF